MNACSLARQFCIWRCEIYPSKLSASPQETMMALVKDGRKSLWIPSKPTARKESVLLNLMMVLKDGIDIKSKITLKHKFRVGYPCWFQSRCVFIRFQRFGGGYFWLVWCQWSFESPELLWGQKEWKGPRVVPWISSPAEEIFRNLRSCRNFHQVAFDLLYSSQPFSAVCNMLLPEVGLQ